MTKVPIQLLFKVKFERLKNEVIIKIWCKDNYAITWMSDHKVLKALVKSEMEQGSKIAMGHDKDGRPIAIQLYKDKTGKEIAKKITKELHKATGGNLKTG